MISDGIFLETLSANSFLNSSTVNALTLMLLSSFDPDLADSRSGHGGSPKLIVCD
jgi:hypothetical protein